MHNQIKHTIGNISKLKWIKRQNGFSICAIFWLQANATPYLP